MMDNATLILDLRQINSRAFGGMQKNCIFQGCSMFITRSVDSGGGGGRVRNPETRVRKEKGNISLFAPPDLKS